MHRFVVLLLATAAGWPATAAAAPVTLERDGATFEVREGARRVCVQPRSDGAIDGSARCERTPVGPFTAITLPAERVTAVVVDRDVAAVESGGDRVETTALPGGTARAALVRRAGPDAIVRTFDAAGTLVGAVQPQDQEAEGGRVAYRQRGFVLRVRAGVSLDPTPLLPDRTVPTVCLSTESDRGGASECLRTEDLGAFRAEVTDRCAPRRPVVSGLVSDRVARLRIVLGDGRRVVVPTRPLPAGVGAGRLVAGTLPLGLAVRTIGYEAADGRVLSRAPVGQQPTGRACDASIGDSLIGFGIAGGPKPVTPLVPADAGSPLRVADGPDLTLCQRLRGRPVSCRTPPVTAEASLVDRRGRTLGGVLPRAAATLRLRLDGGRRLDVPTTPGADYTGAYAGTVRFVAVTLPAGREVRDASAVTADGRQLGEVFVTPRLTTRTSRRQLPDGLRSTRTRTTINGRSRTDVCVGPRKRVSPLGPICLYRDTVQAVVTCSPRRTLLLGTPGARAPVVRLRDGTVLRPPVRRVRGLGRYWSLRLGRSAAVASVRQDRETTRLDLPPAARQCGYQSESGELA